jgi:hypothetical protein
MKIWILQSEQLKKSLKHYNKKGPPNMKALFLSNKVVLISFFR